MTSKWGDESDLERRKPRGSWEFYVDQRTTLLHLGRMMFMVAGLSLLPWVFGKPITVPIAVLLAMYGCWAFNVRQLLGTIADKQAALDMKRIAKRQLQPGERINLAAGDSVRLEGSYMLTSSATVTLTVERMP